MCLCVREKERGGEERRREILSWGLVLLPLIEEMTPSKIVKNKEFCSIQLIPWFSYFLRLVEVNSYEQSKPIHFHGYTFSI